ncbi:MAG: tetratricopeptide repeat protein, partial [Bacteroidota bacterium]
MNLIKFEEFRMSVFSLLFHPRYILLSIISVSLIACKQGVDKAGISELEQSYQALLEANGPSSQGEDITALSQKLTNAYMDFAEAQPSDPESVEYLYKASEHLESPLKKPEEAIEVLQKIAAQYPEHPRAADAMFRTGYIYHNTLQDLDQAKNAYNAFIEKYPDHELIPSAKFEVNNLGVSTQELLERIQQQNQ